MAKITVDVGQMTKFAQAILSRIDDAAAKKKTSQQIQVAVNKAIAAGKAGDQATVDKVFANLQNAAKKPAKKRAPKKAAADKPAAKPAAKPESRTPRLDKMAEGAKPMDEAMRASSKDEALEKMSRDVVSEDDYAEWSARAGGVDERADDELLDFTDEGVGSEPSRTLGGPKDKTEWTPTGRRVTVTKEDVETVKQLSDAQLKKLEGVAGGIALKRRKEVILAGLRKSALEANEKAKAAGKPAPNKDVYKGIYRDALNERTIRQSPEYKEIYEKELARLEKEYFEGKGGELKGDVKRFVSARRFSTTEQRAIAKRNKNLRRGGKPEMDADEEDEFVKNLRNPKGEVRRFSSMPKLEEKNLPEPKTKRERFEGKREGESFAESLKKVTPAKPRKRVKKMPVARVSEGLRTKAQAMGRKAREANKGKDPSSDKAFAKFVEAQRPKRPELRGIAKEDPRRLMAWKQAVKEFEDLKNELRKEWLNGWNT